MNTIFKRPKAQKLKRQADIVFCIDVTGSMNPCIEGVLNGVDDFVENLNSAAYVDYRLRLIGFRDIHDPSVCNDEWNVFPFTSDSIEFRNWLKSLRAFGGGDSPESTLDALYMALHSDWRKTNTLRAIILLTDSDSHPKLHSKTYAMFNDNDVYRVIQDFQELRHSLLFIVAPKYEIYQQIVSSMQMADRKIFAKWVPVGDARYKGLKEIDWKPLMSMIGQVISSTSIVVMDKGLP
jgi:hypothetical protein